MRKNLDVDELNDTATMIDIDAHYGVDDYRLLLDYMPAGWREHFDHEEFFESVAESSSHMALGAVPPEPDKVTGALASGQPRMLTSHQALSTNGWSDRVAASVFVGAFNRFALERSSDYVRLGLAVNGADLASSPQEVEKHADNPAVVAVALPTSTTLLGDPQLDRLYEVCEAEGLPIFVHFSGVEGRYAGAPPLAGGIHWRDASRSTLMYQLAETNLASLAFQGTMVKYPRLRWIFAGFGFAWLPSSLWRLDKDWSNFRYDIPWVAKPPSEYIRESVYCTTWPVRMLDQHLRSSLGGVHWLPERVIFGSHGPFGDDSIAETIAAVRDGWVADSQRVAEALMTRSLVAA